MGLYLQYQAKPEELKAWTKRVDNYKNSLEKAYSLARTLTQDEKRDFEQAAANIEEAAGKGIDELHFNGEFNLDLANVMAYFMQNAVSIRERLQSVDQALTDDFEKLLFLGTLGQQGLEQVVDSYTKCGYHGQDISIQGVANEVEQNIADARKRFEDKYGIFLTKECDELDLRRCLIRKMAVDTYERIYGDEDMSEEDRKKIIDNIIETIIDNEILKNDSEDKLRRQIYAAATDAEKLVLDYFAAKNKSQDNGFKQNLVDLLDRWSSAVEEGYDEYITSVLEKLGQIKELYESHLHIEEAKQSNPSPAEKKKGIRAWLSSRDQLFKLGVGASIAAVAAYVGITIASAVMLGGAVIKGERKINRTIYENVAFYDKDNKGKPIVDVDRYEKRDGITVRTGSKSLAPSDFVEKHSIFSWLWGLDPMTPEEEEFYNANYENLIRGRIRDEAERAWKRDKRNGKTQDSFPEWLKKRPDLVKQILDPFS